MSSEKNSASISFYSNSAWLSLLTKNRDTEQPISLLNTRDTHKTEQNEDTQNNSVSPRKSSLSSSTC